MTDRIGWNRARKLEREGLFWALSSFMLSRIDGMQGIPPETKMIENRYFSGKYYLGSRRYGHPHGSGKIIELNGDVYDGTFVLGLSQGQGRMHFQNGDRYEGSWLGGRMDGEGTMVYAKTGNTYVGGFKAGRRHGRGRMEYTMAEAELRLCQICYEEDIDSLFYDCGHVCSCLHCAKQLDDCPICRKPIINVVKMYFT